MSQNAKVMNAFPPGDMFSKKAKLDLNNYDFFRKKILAMTGIELGENKQALIEARLSRRLVSLGFESFKEYALYLSKHPEEEGKFINCLTTNKTDWFREPQHFKYLTEKALPQLRDLPQEKPGAPLYVWSAACSSGEEVYSLAMALNEAGSLSQRDFRILGTDIDTYLLLREN